MGYVCHCTASLGLSLNIAQQKYQDSFPVCVCVSVCCMCVCVCVCECRFCLANMALVKARLAEEATGETKTRLDSAARFSQVQSCLNMSQHEILNTWEDIYFLSIKDVLYFEEKYVVYINSRTPFTFLWAYLPLWNVQSLLLVTCSSVLYPTAARPPPP